ncbi:LLM class flavin-dependent oxidoreductase [Actinomadura sp. DC4]|uniref:LLM class flavin-dependent oxidoreductase n=1 Tax=Actinomadura sp. DC4 TaxID=3055069 RepID=UPI0025B1E71D|nr:LLM class flavin-dependent oxidoreductase [Actinomadura sp. DC4]MDN3356357.1 LLM class flavin-dependent oxidoreductase [Actinomadura sp. DC4]
MKLRLCVNWLPITPELTRGLARRVERAGLWGLGIGDSPNYGELYTACADALSATDALAVLTSVTNPVTRHVSVHVSAARTYGGRLAIGMGRGDSAVRTFGLRPATLPELERTLESLREAVPEAPLLVAAGGPAAARVAGRAAGGVICGAGRDPQALAGLAGAAREAAGRPVDRWASVRLAVARTPAEVPGLRSRILPRAISAARFNFGRDLAGKNVPDALQEVLTARFAAYDFAWHGRAGGTPTARMFADRPDVEEYLLDRFAVVGTAQDCRDRLADLHRHVDGIFLSLLFEDVLEQADRLADLFTPDELETLGR